MPKDLSVSKAHELYLTNGTRQWTQGRLETLINSSLTRTLHSASNTTKAHLQLCLIHISKVIYIKFAIMQLYLIKHYAFANAKRLRLVHLSKDYREGRITIIEFWGMSGFCFYPRQLFIRGKESSFYYFPVTHKNRPCIPHRKLYRQNSSLALGGLRKDINVSKEYHEITSEYEIISSRII